MKQKLLRDLGRYTLIARLGEGGMGSVFLAVMRGSAGFDKLLVVKTLLPHLAHDPTFSEMFLREARLCLALSHPNVVQTYDVSKEGDEYFIVMEYLRGHPLNTIRDLHPAKRPPDRLALKILLDALDGLHYAHELKDIDGNPQNIVHRDVSPHNIFVTYQGTSKLLDFGIAKTVADTGLTKSGMVKGKYGYMAPEQARGETVDRRSDVFSVGIILWEILAGRKMMENSAEAIQIAARIQGDEPKLLDVRPSSDPELAAICDRATAHEPADRYATAKEMRSALEAYLIDKGALPTSDEIADWMHKRYADARAREEETVQRQIKRIHTSMTDDDASAVRMLDFNPESAKANSTTIRTRAEVPKRSQRRARSPRVAYWTAGIVALVAAAGAVVLLDRKETDAVVEGPTVSLALGKSAPKKDAALRDSAPATRVQVSITARPRHATMMLDGKALKANPYEASLPRDEGEHTLEVSAPGYVGQKRTLRFGADVSLAIGLRRRPVKTAAAPKTTPSPPRPAPPTSRPKAKTPPSKKQTPGIDMENPYK